VRINVVAPGAVDTPGLNASTGKNDQVKKIITDAIPMQRAATPEEISEAICFLGSDDASFITGVILPVDGGKTPQLYVPAFDLTNLDNQAENR
jgi:NAD(P)-dependent dehydrogenase (short-subunit alcohol dehydrogenase family)